MLAKLITFPAARNAVQATEEGEKLSAILQLLNRVSSIADNSSLTTAQAIEGIFAEVCSYTGWPIGHIYTESPSEPKTYTSPKLWHFDKSLDQSAIQEFRSLSESTVFTLGNGLIGLIAETHQAKAVEDVTVLKQFLRADAARRNNVRGFFGFPIMLSGNCIGVAEFYGREVGLLDDISLEIMTYVSSQLARVFERDQVAKNKSVMMGQFETNVQGAVEELSITSKDLSTASTHLTGQCEASLATCTTVVEGAENINACNRELETTLLSLNAVEEQTEARIAEVAATVNALAQEVGLAIQQLDGLKQAAEDITGIVGDVSEIAGQVRMLGLNASIEAARAGEAGKGFSVVATEIKSLAEQSEGASHDIGEKIQAIQDVIKTSTQTMGSVGSSMNTLEQTAEEMTSVITGQRNAIQAIEGSVTTSKNAADLIAGDISTMNSTMEALTKLSDNLSGLADNLGTTATDVSRSSTQFLDMMKA